LAAESISSKIKGRTIVADSFFEEGRKMPRDTYRYHFIQGNRIVYSGITTDLKTREREHRQRFGEDGHIKQVGPATTRDTGLVWETRQTELGNPTRKSLN